VVHENEIVERKRDGTVKEEGKIIEEKSKVIIPTIPVPIK
jgi:hypothetical protein